MLLQGCVQGLYYYSESHPVSRYTSSSGTSKRSPMTRNVLTLMAILACGTLLVPTAAMPVDNAATTAVSIEDAVDPVDEDENILLMPADGPNGMYAEIEDGQLRLDLASVGVNDNSLTAIDEIFEIVNVGDANATVYLDSGVEDVHFYQGTETDESLEGPSNNVTLAQNEQIAVGIAIDTRDPDHDVESMGTFSVHTSIVEEKAPAPEPPDTPTPEPTPSPESTPTPSPEAGAPSTVDETPTPTPEETSAPTPVPEETVTPTPDVTEEGDDDTAILDAGTTEDDGAPSNTALVLLLLGVVAGGAVYTAQRALNGGVQP